jgi:hypothetical protein
MCTRAVNVNEFPPTLLSKTYEYQEDALLTIVFDYCIRICENEDYIPGVDNIPGRGVVDYYSGQYSGALIDFLLRRNVCVLNGTFFSRNDFTSVSLN